MDQDNRPSSVYSSDASSRKPLHLETRTNGSSSRPSSRATSYTPSYMSNLATRAPNGQRSNPIPISQKPIRTAPETPTVAPLPPAGALLILSPGQLHPSLLLYLEILLERQALSSIVIAASTTQETKLKQLRMDVFALLGKMRREVAVSVDMQEKWTKTEIENAVQQATKGGQVLQGVLCCPELVEEEQATDDVLNMGEDQLEDSWKRSVGFLHMASRAALPYLLPNGKSEQQSNGSSTKLPQDHFFLVTQPSAASAASQLSKVSFDALVTQLEIATRSKGLTIGHAEIMLIPKPRKASPPPQYEPSLQPSHRSLAENGFTPSESPTKLWNMWALQNDIPDN